MKARKELILTLIQEIEAVISNRPLIYIDDDINSEGALTPAHFLSINFKTGIPDIDISYNQYENLANVLLENWESTGVSRRKLKMKHRVIVGRI